MRKVASPKIAAITGTNGKSTTRPPRPHRQIGGQGRAGGGNIGLGVLGLEEMHGGAVYVLELSSYQLDLTSSLKADAAVAASTSPRITWTAWRHGWLCGRQAPGVPQSGEGRHAIIGVDDDYGQQICTEITAANRRTIRPISAKRAIGRGVYALSGMLYDASGRTLGGSGRPYSRQVAARPPQLAERRRRLRRRRGCRRYADRRGTGPDDLPRSAHRMENLPAIGKVRSSTTAKATNADAARQAMSAIPKFYWIAGGVPKAGGIEPLTDLFPRIEKAYLIGEAAADFAKTLNGHAPAVIAGDIAAATEMAFRDARASGDDAVVLLSPACASFDQFPDFEVRGDAFRAAVTGLA